MVDVVVLEDATAMARRAADRFTSAAVRAIRARERFVVALAGGSTPTPVYDMLSRDRLDALQWAAVHFFFSDERCVPPDHAASNYGMAARALLAKVPARPEHVYRVRGELECGTAAREYDHVVAEFFAARDPAALPARHAHAFDLVLLGLGADGHTASLFPGSPALESTRWAACAHAPPGVTPRERVTLTLPAVNAAEEVLLLAHGAEKRDAVTAALSETTGSATSLPVSRVHGRARVTWLLDRAAAPSDLD